MDKISEILHQWLLNIGVNENISMYLNMLILLVGMVVLIWIIDFIIRKVLITIFGKIAAKTSSNFDDLLIKNKLPRNVAHIIPLLIAIEFIPTVFNDFESVKNLSDKALQLFIVLLVLRIVRSFLNTLRDYFKTLPRLKDKPIDSYIQVFMIFAWVAGFMVIFAILTGTPIWQFVTALGAASAVILLIFKDTILGFVASIQVSINDMVRIGDWITFEKYGADGDVVEITLATVKVQNFDKTITTIPTYALISDSFKNWRGMTDSEGRRIKRALIIKLNSVKYLTKHEINELKKIELISAYVQKREKDIDSYNEKNNINKDLLINGRNLTNIGVFRKYMESYVEHHSGINKDMMLMTRQLAPTTQGIPMEIYAFSSDKRWENYEYIMADIFDHLIPATRYFDLEVFELPDNKTLQTSHNSN
jgi:miniconductance mechanosensitive channel